MKTIVRGIARCAPLLFMLALSMVGGIPAMAAPAAPATVKDIAKEMICPCPDCGKQALDQCPSCSVGEKLRSEIGAMLQQGKSKDQIMTQFAATYGDDILGDPPARGFARYAAWMPFMAAALGLIPIAFILVLSARRRKARRANERAAASAAASQNRVATDDPLLRQALRDFDY